VKPQAEAAHGKERRPPADTPTTGSSDVTRLHRLTPEQSAVLDCLQAAGDPLTVRQVQTRTTLMATAVRAALEALAGRDMVARLNTLVPSYTCRYPGIRMHAE